MSKTDKKSPCPVTKTEILASSFLWWYRQAFLNCHMIKDTIPKMTANRKIMYYCM